MNFLIEMREKISLLSSSSYDSRQGEMMRKMSLSTLRKALGVERDMTLG
jgi:hypothetical protein